MNNKFHVASLVSNYKHAAFSSLYSYEDRLEHNAILVVVVAAFISMVGAIPLNSAEMLIAGAITGLLVMVYSEVSETKLVKYIRKIFVYLIWGRTIRKNIKRIQADCRKELHDYLETIESMKHGTTWREKAIDAEKILACTI